ADGVDENDSGKFWEEFNILKGLDPHKHVVGLVGIVKTHVPALVVEYCHGGDLQSHLRKSSQSRANMIGRRFSHSRSTSTNDSSSASTSNSGKLWVDIFLPFLSLLNFKVGNVPGVAFFKSHFFSLANLWDQ
ncbi:unnamed protein product, partial [Allacma fusca]